MLRDDVVFADDDEVPLGFASSDVAMLRTAIARHLGRLTEAVLAIDGAAVTKSRSVPPSTVRPGWLQALLGDAPLCPSDRMRRVMPCRRHLEDDRAVLTTTHRVVSVPGIAALALRVLCESEEVSAASFDDLDVESQLLGAKRLLRDGILVRVPAP